VKRRAWLLGAAASALSPLWGRAAFAETPESRELEQRDLMLEGDARLARRALLLVPKHLPRPRAVLVLLHGLGETGNELLGIHAWGDRYGLVSAYERLRKPPIERLFPKLEYLEQNRAEELNALLSRNPFHGLALVCPVTPNPHRLGVASRVLDRYADWLSDELLPRVRQELGAPANGLKVGLDGCSLGGYVGLEVLLRRPELFHSFGVVQAAIGKASAENYAVRIAETIAAVGPRPIHIETSSLDPYRGPSRRLAEALGERGVPNQFRLAPGPHNQPWLREIGTLEMLLWHDRQLNHDAA